MKIFPTDNDKLAFFVVLSFLLGVFLGYLISTKTDNSGVLLTVIATLVGAFVGTFSAFKIEDNNKKREKDNERLERANKVIYALYERIVFLKNIQINCIDPESNSPIRAITMRPASNFTIPEGFKVTDILFLLGSGHEQLVLDLQLEKTRFESVSSTFEQWIKLYSKEVEPALEKQGIKNGESYTDTQIIDAMGDRLHAYLVQTTNSLINDVDKSIDSHIYVKSELVKALQEKYPNKDIFDYINA